MQGEIITLRDEVRALSINSNLRPHDVRTDEVIIGGFGLKSKDDAINMVNKIINGKMETQRLL